MSHSHWSESTQRQDGTPFRLLAWPRYDRSRELDFLFREFGAVVRRHRRHVALQLRHDPDRDPPLALARWTLSFARWKVFGLHRKPEVHILTGAIAPHEIPLLRPTVDWVAALPSGDGEARTAFHLALGAPSVANGQDLLAALETARAADSQDLYDRVQTSQVLVNGTALELSYPHTPGILSHVRDVLGGKDYPLFLRDRWQAATVVDIGAHIGCAALFFATAWPEARVLSFEPSARSFEFLRANCSQLSTIEIFPVGLFDEQRSLILHHGATSSMQNSVVASQCSGPGTETVELRRASSELRRLLVDRISVLKIDTEGCELAILRDLAEWLPNTDFLYLEYHSASDRLAIEELLRPHFLLCAARTDSLHRGTNVFMTRALVERFPDLAADEICAAR